MEMLLNKKVIGLNGFEREVAIKIEGDKMFGVLNKTRFIWEYTQHELPKVEVKNGADGIKAAKYGRLYILKRLEMDNVVLPIKTKARTVNYITIEESNGVWMNCFTNGYIRGSVDGVAFTWDPTKYQQAAAVNTAGFKGSIVEKIDTNRIKARLREAGYTSLKVLMAAIEAKTIVASSTIVEQPSEKHIIIESTSKLTVKYHENGFLSGCVGTQVFSWKNNSTTLPGEIVKVVNSFDDMNGLVEFYNGVFTSPTLPLMNELAIMFKKYNDLNDLIQYIHEGDRTAKSILKTLNNRMDCIEESICEGDEIPVEYVVLKEAIDKTSSMITIDGQISMDIA